MVTDGTVKKPERRRSPRAVKTTELSWEDKVLKRVGRHAVLQSQSNADLGWEAASVEVLKSHAREKR
jgi:hypothetical protein